MGNENQNRCSCGKCRWCDPNHPLYARPDAAPPKANYVHVESDEPEPETVTTVSHTEEVIHDATLEHSRTGVHMTGAPSESPTLEELNAIGNVLGSVASAPRAHMGLSGDVSVPQIRVTHAVAACKAWKSLRAYFAAHTKGDGKPISYLETHPGAGTGETDDA